jgi:hypothetical protein
LETAVDRLDDLDNARIYFDVGSLAIVCDIKFDRAIVKGARSCHWIAFDPMLTTGFGFKEPDVGR